MLRGAQHGTLLVLLLVFMLADPSSAGDRETIRQHIATALTLKDSKSWDASIGEFRKVLTMRSAADHSTWTEATDGMNALCHGQSPQAYSSQYVFLVILLRTRNKRRLAHLVTGQSI